MFPVRGRAERKSWEEPSALTSRGSMATSQQSGEIWQSHKVFWQFVTRAAVWCQKRTPMRLWCPFGEKYAKRVDFSKRQKTEKENRGAKRFFSMLARTWQDWFFTERNLHQMFVRSCNFFFGFFFFLCLYSGSHDKAKKTPHCWTLKSNSLQQ